MSGSQQSLPLPFPELTGDQPLLPLRMINEFVYCPRLAYLEWVQGEWAPNRETVEGSHAHRRVDKPKGALPQAPEGEADEDAVDTRIHARSVDLSSVRLGLVGKLDLIEGEGDCVQPVDYKRGKRPHVPRGAYDPERVQLCAQGMLLREAGFQCDHGFLYFVASRERVRVDFDEELEELTRSAIHGLRALAQGGQIPQPLVDSPKCPRCSLVTICLPDEVNWLKLRDTPPRPLSVGRTEALPLYVQAWSAKVSKRGETLEVSVEDKKVAEARLIEVSQLALMGNIYVTTPTLQELMAREIPVTWSSFGGWFHGHTVGVGHKNIELRTAQFRHSFDERRCLSVARALIRAKIHNQRTFLRRNWKDGEADPDIISGLRADRRNAERAESLGSLLGIEGAAASRYFGSFGALLRPPGGDTHSFSFDFAKRERRPPPDPVNALLSFAYSMLARTLHVTLSGVGFDSYRGYYHQPRYGRPALALDLMEPFRPIIADSVVLQVINNGEIKATDFVRSAHAVNLNPDGRKRFIAAFERRLSHEISHPVFGYRLSYRRLLELEARLFGRWLLGEIDTLEFITVR
jgi:CRISPR-associated endonuclease Cas1/CRISPR-associated protein Cas4